VVTNICAVDEDLGQNLTYSLTGSGNASFALGSGGGVCARIVSSMSFNFEAISFPFALTLGVCDNGTSPGPLCTSSSVMVTVLNVNESPTLSNASIGLNENAVGGAAVGSPLVSVDPDSGDVVTFSITSGSSITSIFYIAPLSDRVAQITMLPSLNQTIRSLSTLPPYIINIRVMDVAGLFSDAVMNVTLVQGNDPPVVVPATFLVAENMTLGAAVGALSWGIARTTR